MNTLGASTRSKVFFIAVVFIGAVCIYFAQPVYHSLKSDFIDANLMDEAQLNTEIASLEKQITDNKTLVVNIESDIEKLLPEQTLLTASLEKNSQEQSSQCAEGVSAVEQKKTDTQKQLDQTVVDIADQQKIVTTTTARQAELQKSLPPLQQSLKSLTNSIKPDQQKIIAQQSVLTTYDTQMKAYVVQRDQKQLILEKANTDLKSAQASIAPLQASVLEKISQITANTTKISQNNRQASANVSLLKTATAQVAAAKAQIASLQTKISANVTKIQSLNAQITSYQSQVTTLQAKIASLQQQTITRSITSQINTAQSSLVATQGNISTTQKNIATLQAQNAETQKQVDAVNLTIPTLQKNVDTITASNAAIANETKNLTATNTALQGELSSLNKTLTAAQNNDKIFAGQVRVLTSDIAKLKTQIDVLQVKIDATNGQIKTLQSKIAGTQAQIATATQDLTVASKELETVKVQNAEAKKQISKLQADQKDLQESLVEIQKRFDTCQVLDIERAKLQTQFDTLSATITDKKRDRKHYQLLVASLEASLQSAKDALKELKRKQITCTVVGDEYKLTRGDGSTDFSWETISMGSPDPYVMKFETEYTLTSVTTKADMYVSGIKVSCPDSTLSIPNDEPGTPLEACTQMKAWLEQDGEDASIITCTGDYSFITERHAPKPLTTTISDKASSLFSSFLSSNIFGNWGSLKSDAIDPCAGKRESLADYWRQKSELAETLASAFRREDYIGQLNKWLQEDQARLNTMNDNWDDKTDAEKAQYNTELEDYKRRLFELDWEDSALDDRTKNIQTLKKSIADLEEDMRQLETEISECEKGYCGDGKVDSGEECDGGDHCESCRKVPYCGDGNTDSGEECDGGDNCDSSCHSVNNPYCGNGTVDSGEECDGGNECDGSCHKINTPFCGNGTVDAGEECDGGTECDGSCHKIASCGNGTIEAGEECDGGDNCDSACRNKTASCGNSTVDSGEECDDGNHNSGDGCSPSCQKEPGYCGDGNTDPGEECDDGNTAGGDGCYFCRKEVLCGNGLINDPEQCDDGNTADGDGCSSTCTKETSPSCGDGTVDSGEECDDGNTANGDGCDSLCVQECDPNAGGLWSSFFGWFGGFGWLKSQATGWKNCTPKGCTIKAAENYKGPKPEYEDDQTCTCKNGLNPYEYDTCSCQPAHDWCYRPKNGVCEKMPRVPRFFFKLFVRNGVKICASCVSFWVWSAVPTLPIGADMKLYNPYKQAKAVFSDPERVMANECWTFKK